MVLFHSLFFIILPIKMQFGGYNIFRHTQRSDFWFYIPSHPSKYRHIVSHYSWVFSMMKPSLLGQISQFFHGRIKRCWLDVDYSWSNWSSHYFSVFYSVFLMFFHGVIQLCWLNINCEILIPHGKIQLKIKSLFSRVKPLFFISKSHVFPAGGETQLFAFFKGMSPFFHGKTPKIWVNSSPLSQAVRRCVVASSEMPLTLRKLSDFDRALAVQDGLASGWTWGSSERFRWCSLAISGSDLLELPSGKRLHNELERSTMFNGKIHYKWSCSIAMLNYQKVPFVEAIWGYVRDIPRNSDYVKFLPFAEKAELSVVSNEKRPFSWELPFPRMWWGKTPLRISPIPRRIKICGGDCNKVNISTMLTWTGEIWRIWMRLDSINLNIMWSTSP